MVSLPHVTGKPVEYHGLPGREEATGRGVGLLTLKLLSRLGRRIPGTRVVIQGFGNVGTHTAKFLRDAECRIIAVGDATANFYREEGLDVLEMIRYVHSNGGTLAADAFFDEIGVTVLPDILCNAGGVTASWFEWVQNRQHYQWGMNRVRQELDRILGEAFEQVWQLASSRKVSLRTAAFMLGVGRVHRATELGGIE